VDTAAGATVSSGAPSAVGKCRRGRNGLVIELVGSLRSCATAHAALATIGRRHRTLALELCQPSVTSVLDDWVLRLVVKALREQRPSDLAEMPRP
jgi:hypothetical protein